MMTYFPGGVDLPGVELPGLVSFDLLGMAIGMVMHAQGAEESRNTR